MNCSARLSIAGGMGLSAVAAALLSALAAPAVAEEGVSLRSITGPFSRSSIEGTWCQRILLLVNESDAAVRVKAAYVASEPGGSKTAYARVVAIPPRSQRRTTVGARVGQLVTTEQKLKEYLLAFEQYTLSDPVTGEVLQSKQENRTAKLPPNPTTLAIIRGRDWEKFDTDSYISELPSHLMGKVHRAGTSLQELPDRWYGYGMIKLVLLGGVDSTSVRPSQWQALLDWARRGGVLVLLGSRSMPEMLQGPLAQAAGVTTAGVHVVDSLQQIREIHEGDKDQGWPKAVALRGPLSMTELCPDETHLLLEANGLPLLTRRAFGNGQVLALAVPLGALTEPKVQRKVFSLIGEALDSGPSICADRFWEIREGDPRPRPTKKLKTPPPKIIRPGQHTLNQIAGRRGPHQGVPLGILAGLGLLAALGGVMLRLRGRGELLWIALIPATVLLGVGMHLYGSLQTEPERLGYLALVSGLDPGFARVQELFAYYSGPSDQTLSFSAGQQHAVIAHLQETTGVARSVEARCEATMTLPNCPVKKNSIRGFQVETVARTEGVGGTLTFGEPGLTGTLHNHLPADIEDAVIYVNRRTYRLGTIPAGQPWTVSVNDSRHLLGHNEFTGSGRLVHTPIDLLRNDLLRQLVRPPAGGLASRRALRHGRTDLRPILVGYSSFSPLEPLAERDLRGQGWSVIVWPVNVARPPAGTKVAIPTGFVHVETVPAIWDPLAGRFLEHNTDAEVTLRAYLPRQVALRGAEAALTVSVRAPEYRLTIYGVAESADGAQPRTELEKVDNPLEMLTVLKVPDANRFRSDKDGSYVFVLAVKEIEASADEPARVGRPGEVGHAPLGTVRTKKWRFVRIEVALKGTSQ